MHAAGLLNLLFELRPCKAGSTFTEKYRKESYQSMSTSKVFQGVQFFLRVYYTKLVLGWSKLALSFNLKNTWSIISFITLLKALQYRALQLCLVNEDANTLLLYDWFLYLYTDICISAYYIITENITICSRY